MLGTNTVTTVHQRLRDEHGLTASIASFRRYVRLEFPGEVAASKVTVLRPEVAPGEEAQIDYGFLGSWLDPVVPCQASETDSGSGMLVVGVCR